MNAMSTQRNKYIENRKNHTIYTPLPICYWLHSVLTPVWQKMKPGDVVFDPCVGSGNLLRPFDNFTRIGMDTDDLGCDFLDGFQKGDFLSVDTMGTENMNVGLVNMNPPYNHTKESSSKYGRGSLLPELFASKVFELFGKDQKMVMFTPMGFRLNIRCAKPSQGDRYRNIRDNMGKITGIASLPLDVFHNPDFDPDALEGPKGVVRDGVKLEKSNLRRKETQQEIIFFNMPEIDPHPMIPDIVFDALRDIDKEMG